MALKAPRIRCRTFRWSGAPDRRALTRCPWKARLDRAEPRATFGYRDAAGIGHSGLPVPTRSQPEIDRSYINRFNVHMTDEPRWSAGELRSELNRYEEMLRSAGKARNTINTYVQHPERFINWLEGRYRPAQPGQSREPALTPSDGSRGGPGTADKSMSRASSRYDPLRSYLAGRSEPVIHLSFAEIERIIGGRLPDSARRHRPWWANERSGSHVHASAWMAVGRRTANVDLSAGKVDFTR